MIRKNDKGFTLVELLVVIAIIGVLSTIIIVALNKARDKSADSKTKAQLAGLRSAAGNYFDDNDGYGGVTDACDEEMFIDASSGMLSYTTPANYPAPGSTTLSCHSDGVAFAVSAGLNAADPKDFWCVDSTGKSKAEPDSLGAGDVACP